MLFWDKKVDMNNKSKIVTIRFLGQSRPCNFLVGNLKVNHGDRVIAMSDRGMAIGFVNSSPFDLPKSDDIRFLRTITRIATKEDIQTCKNLYQQQKESRKVFNQLVIEHQLTMKLVDIEYTSFGKKALFYFSSPGRVDFRDFLKALSAKINAQITLRQIPSDDKSPIATIGPCGMERCLFINSVIFKEEGGNRRCNEFTCCLDSKDPFYEDKRSRLPRVGDYITTHSGEVGRVERLHLWHEEFEMITDQGHLKRYTSNQKKEKLDKKSVDFPKYFEIILDKTKTTVGVDEKKTASEAESDQYIEESKAFADRTFDLLFGKTSLDLSLPEIGE
jgi:cell fate regulator YaaT (PSP1 superfamily)